MLPKLRTNIPQHVSRLQDRSLRFDKKQTLHYVKLEDSSHSHVEFSTRAILSIRQEGWDDDDPCLPDTHAQKTLIHAFNDVPLPQVGVIGRILQVTKGGIISSSRISEKQQTNT